MPLPEALASKIRSTKGSVDTSLDLLLDGSIPEDYIPPVQGLELIKRDEGFRANPYKDQSGIWHHSFGLKIEDKRVNKNTKYENIPDEYKNGTREMGEKLASRKITEVHRPNVIDTLGTETWENLSPDLQATLISQSYQTGVSGFRGFKKMIAALKAGDLEGARSEYLDSKVAREQSPERWQRGAKKFVPKKFDDGYMDRVVDINSFLNDGPKATTVGFPEGETNRRDTPESIDYLLDDQVPEDTLFADPRVQYDDSGQPVPRRSSQDVAVSAAQQLASLYVEGSDIPGKFNFLPMLSRLLPASILEKVAGKSLEDMASGVLPSEKDLVKIAESFPPSVQLALASATIAKGSALTREDVVNVVGGASRMGLNWALLGGAAAKPGRFTKPFRGAASMASKALVPRMQAMSNTGQMMPVPITPAAGLGALQITQPPGWGGRPSWAKADPKPGTAYAWTGGARPLDIKPGESKIHSIPLNQISATARQFPRAESSDAIPFFQDPQSIVEIKRELNMIGRKNDPLRVVMMPNGQVFITLAQPLHNEIGHMASGGTMANYDESAEPKQIFNSILEWDAEKGHYEQVWPNIARYKDKFGAESKRIELAAERNPVIRMLTGKPMPEEGGIAGALVTKQRSQAEAIVGRMKILDSYGNPDDSGSALKQFLSGQRAEDGYPPKITFIDPETGVRFELWQSSLDEKQNPVDLTGLKRGKDDFHIEIGNFNLRRKGSPFKPNKGQKQIYSQGVLMAMLDILKENIPNAQKVFGKRTTTGKIQEFNIGLANGGLVGALRSRLAS